MQEVPKNSFPESPDIESSTDDYARRFDGPVGQWMLERQRRFVLFALEDLPGSTVLDVGGGHGQLAVPLAERGHELTVLGSDPVCSRQIEEAVQSEILSFTVGNAIALPYPDKSFDVVITFRMVTHCRAWEQLLAECCRVARHRVVFDYPTSQSLNAIAPVLYGAKKKIEKNTRPWRLFKHSEIAAVLNDAGYALRRSQPQFFLPMVLHRALGCLPLSRMMDNFCTGLGLTRRWGSPVVAEAVPVP